MSVLIYEGKFYAMWNLVMNYARRYWFYPFKSFATYEPWHQKYNVESILKFSDGRKSASWIEWAHSSTPATASYHARTDGSAEWDSVTVGSASAATLALWWWWSSASPSSSHLSGIPQHAAAFVHSGRGSTWCWCMAEGSGIKIPTTQRSLFRCD